MTEERQVRNPFRNEGDAFRIVLMIFGAALIVIALGLLVSALAGALVGLVFVGIGAWRAWGWLRYWLGSDSA